MVKIQNTPSFDFSLLFDRSTATSLNQVDLNQLFDTYVGQSGQHGDPISFAVNTTPMNHANFSHLMTQDPRAAMGCAKTQAIKSAGGVDRSEAEAAIRDLFQQLNRSGLPLEPRPGSRLAEAWATGDFSSFSTDELVQIMIALALFSKKRDQAAGHSNMPFAPSGSWGANGNTYGGGTNHTGVNADAAKPTGAAPADGTIPPGTNAGTNLAYSAQSVASKMGSTGYCYRGVKAAVKQATGVQLTGGSAYQAAGQLASSGRFEEVGVGPSQLKSLPPGAVVVWDQTAKSPHGHISVALGNGREASDHVQSQMTSLRGHQNYRVFVPVG